MDKKNTSIYSRALFESPSWLEWTKLLEITWNYRHSPICFLISFLKVFRRTMSQKILGESYNALFSFGIIIEVNILKWNGQWLIHVLAILTMLLRHFSFLITTLRHFHDIQSGLYIDKSLHLIITLLNSLLENGIQIDVSFDGISSKISEFICWF